MKEFTAEVVDIREQSRTGSRQRWQMLLSVTAFTTDADRGHLEAIARSGARLEVPVLGVLIDQQGVWHLVDKPLAAGTAVTGRLAD